MGDQNVLLGNAALFSPLPNPYVVPAPSSLHVQLFSGFALSISESQSKATWTPRMRLLIALLVLNHDPPFTRQQLAFTLWPDSSESQARNNLRTLIHHLRKHLPEIEALLPQNTQTDVRQPGHVTSDVADFETAFRNKQWSRAIELYTGDLFPDCYEEWIVRYRDQYRTMYLEALKHLTDWAEDQHDYQRAIDCSKRILVCESVNEEVYCRLMRLYALKGDLASALQVYQECKDVLQRELGITPSDETDQVHAHLVQACRALPGVKSSTSLPLIDRQQEWKTLMTAWERAQLGQPLMVMLTGEAGVGKTRLAEEMERWLTRQGIAVVSSACSIAQSSLAYSLAMSCLRSAAKTGVSFKGLDAIWRTELARALPELLIKDANLPAPTPLAESWQRYRFHEALTRGVCAISQPLLLRIEDIQWCDSDSLDWLGFLQHCILATRLLVLVTARSDETGDNPQLVRLLDGLRHDGCLMNIEVRSLGFEGTKALGEMAGACKLGDAAASKLYEQTEGNALFIIEEMHAVNKSGRQDSAQALTPEMLPDHVLDGMRSMIGSRLAVLSPDAKEVVELASTIGRSFTFDALNHIGAMSEGALVSAVDELWRCHIIREIEPATYQFTHEKVREIICDSVSPTKRRWMHSQIAQMLQALPRDAGSDWKQLDAQIAMHYDLAGAGDIAIPFYHRAAHTSCMLHSYTDALKSVSRAIELINSNPGKKHLLPCLLEEKGDMLKRIGQFAESIRCYGQSACVVDFGLDDNVIHARLERKIGNVLEAQLAFTQSLAAYQRAEEVLSLQPVEVYHAPHAWWHEWVQIQLGRLWISYWTARDDELARISNTLGEVLAEHADPAQQAELIECNVVASGARERHAPSLAREQLARNGVTLAQQSNNDDRIGHANMLLGTCLLLNGCLQEAVLAFQTALAIAEKIANAELQVPCLVGLATSMRLMGQPAMVREYAVRGLDLATRLEMTIYAGTCRACLAWLDWRAGHLPGAQAQAAKALAEWSDVYPFQWNARMPLLGIAVMRGDLGAGIAQARALLAPPQQRLPAHIEQLLSRAILLWDEGKSQLASKQLSMALQAATTLGYA